MLPNQPARTTVTHISSALLLISAHSININLLCPTPGEHTPFHSLFGSTSTHNTSLSPYPAD